MRHWLSDHPSTARVPRHRVVKGNRTDNDSAKMAIRKGVIQRYCGVAAVDDKHQIIVEPQAHGTGSEQALRMPMVEARLWHPKKGAAICYAIFVCTV